MAMRASVQSSLPLEVSAALTGGQANVVATLDADGLPTTSLMTWVVARDPRRIALCVDRRSRSFRNLSERPVVALEILADNVVCGVKGTVRLVKENMDSPPFPCALFVIDVQEARDHGHTGTTFRGPSYAFADDKQHRAGFEQRVYEELRAAE
jgi:hypothetical protein